MTAVASSALTAAFIEARATVVVRFTLSAPDASSVGVAADFNGWAPDALPMLRSPDGAWEATVRLRRDKTYQYNFVVDGTAWIVDPWTPLRLDDGFGGAV
ncbi:isoamylase early set domain-containing protein, partial [Zavarzinia sp.]|uniref:isoamylase early set domain-containing protein n=1 Tax=Zavarzinia sp. TaxID=2027920 RepID=UPI0035676566